MMEKQDKEKRRIELPIYENYEIYAQTEDKNEIHLYGKSSNRSGVCPECGTVSEKVHTSYERTFQDTPIHCKQTLLHIEVHKYKCSNAECNSKVFSEEPAFAKKHQVRTNVLTQFILCATGFFGNETAGQVLKLIGVFVSNDTIQRIYDCLHFENDPDVEETGIDDATIRKGQKYATGAKTLSDMIISSNMFYNDKNSLGAKTTYLTTFGLQKFYNDKNSLGAKTTTAPYYSDDEFYNDKNSLGAKTKVLFVRCRYLFYNDKNSLGAKTECTRNCC